MTSLSAIADKWASNNEINYNDCQNIKNLKNPRKIELVRQIYNDDKKHFRSPLYYCDEIKTQDKKTFNKDIFKKLSNYIELNNHKWIREALNTDLVDIIIKYVQAVVDINRLNSAPIFKEEDVFDLYNCIWLIAGTNLREKLIRHDYLVNLLFFSIVPSYTKLFTQILRIISDLIINNAEKFYGPLIASMELTAQFLHSPSLFKWIIDSLDFSRGMEFISATLDFLLSILNGTGTDSPQKYQYETLMIKDGIVDKLQQFSAFETNQEDNNESSFSAKNSITTFHKLIQLHQNVIFSLFEFDITKETECRVDMFNPLDSSSTFNFLTKCVNDESLIQSFILSSIDINNHTTESYFRHMNRINYFTRIGLRKGYSFNDAFSKAVKMDIELKADFPQNQNESGLTVPTNITDLQMRDDFQNLYTHVFCDYKFTGFWDLPDEPPEMKYTATIEERRETLLKAEQIRILSIEQEELLKKQEKIKNFYEEKLKEILGEEEFTKFLDQFENQDDKPKNQEKPKENQNENNDQISTENEQSAEKVGANQNELPLLLPPPPPPPPPPPSSGHSVKVQPLNPPYKMDHVINIEKVDPGRIKDTIWNEIVPNEFDVDFAPLEEFLKKDASKKSAKIIKKEAPRVIDSSFEKEICIPFKSFKDRCPKIDEASVLKEVKESNPEIDDQNKLNLLAKKEILKKQIEYLKKSLLTINEDEIMPDSFCCDLLRYVKPAKDERVSKYFIVCEKINKIKNNQDKSQDQLDLLNKELETESGMLLETLINIPHIEERLEFIHLKNVYEQTITEFFGPIEDTKKAFQRIRNSEKFKHFLEMSLKIINMMSSTFDKKNNRSGMRGFKLGFISQFTATEERRKNLEAFWIASDSNEAVKGFMDDIQLFGAAKAFDPNETFLQFQTLHKQYKELESKFNELKKNNGGKDDNNNDDEDFAYLMSKWDSYVEEFGQKIVQMTINYDNDCERMYDVMVYFDQCGSVTNNKPGLFRSGARDFIAIIDDIYKAMISAQRRLKLHQEAAERKARQLAKSQAKQTPKADTPFQPSKT